MQDYYREPTAWISVEALRRIQELQVKVGWQSKVVDLRRLVDNSLLLY